MTCRNSSRMRKYGFGDLLSTAFREVGVWRRRSASRAELASLSSRDLSDIGLTPSDAKQEIRKPFWMA